MKEAMALMNCPKVRVEGSLHQSVADAEEREGNEHQAVAVAEDGQGERNDGDDEGEEDGALTPDFVHQQAGGYGEDEEPKEDERGEDIGFGIGEVERFLDIVGSDAHEVYKSHGKESEHHGNEGETRCFRHGGVG